MLSRLHRPEMETFFQDPSKTIMVLSSAKILLQVLLLT